MAWPLSAVSNSLQPRLALGLLRLEIGEHGFAADGALADGDKRLACGRQIDIHARAEANEANALSGPDALALVDEGDDAAGDEPGDLHDGDLGAVGGGDHGGAALVELACLVGRGIEETALHVDGPGDATRHGG